MRWRDKRYAILIFLFIKIRGYTLSNSLQQKEVYHENLSMCKASAGYNGD